MAIANSTNRFGVAKWIVDPTLGKGTHTTISGALTAASSGDTIFIRTATYTENLTLKAGVNLVAFPGDEDTPNVTIVGKLTATYAGTATIGRICLQTNSDNCIAQGGTSATILNLENCYIACSNATAVVFSTANTSARLNMFNCKGDVSGAQKMFDVSTTGIMIQDNCYFTNTANSTTASTISSGTVAVYYCTYLFGWATSSTCAFNFFSTQISTIAVNVVGLSMTGTSASESTGSRISSGTATALSVGSGCTMVVGNINLNSSNANLIAGAGSLTYSQIMPLLTAGTITPTQTKKTNYLGSLSFDGGTNTLDAYSTGTFTPVVVGSTTAGVGTYPYQVGRYTRIGNLVSAYIATGWTAHTGTGTARFSTLPFTVKNTANYVPVGAAHYDNGAIQAINCLDGILNTTYCQLEVGGGAAGSYLAVANSSNGVYGVVNYET